MNGFEIHYRGGAANVEEIFAKAEVARATPLFSADVSEPMLDGNSFAEAAGASGGRDELAEAMLESLVFGHPRLVELSHRAAVEPHSLDAHLRVRLERTRNEPVFAA